MSSSPPARPDPDALLARVQREEARRRRGRLKIFFGASAGVGKTYAMLEAARKQKAEGADLAVGYVELHGRRETEALLDGLEILPSRLLEHRGIALREFDLDAALARRPAIVVVDELAHSNAPGARHPKRWQDIEELLDAGIDVYTTVNVQHVESLNDIVAQITGVQVKETVPDSVFDGADEVELIDLPPDELLQRLREGRVYGGDKTRQALESFFRKGNLIALRQLALRATADRVDAAMRAYREHHAIEQTWTAGERVLVCVGPDALSERVVRAARRLATALHAEWIAVYVETPRLLRLDEAQRDRVLRTLKLAESLGAETANLSGESVASELINFARTRNVSKLLVGKPLRSRWHDRIRSNLLDELVRGSGNIDVYVVTGEEGERSPSPPSLIPRRTNRWPAYLWGAASVLAATGICELIAGYAELTNLVMVYLLATVFVAARFGRGPSVLASVSSVLLFDFLFVQPVYSFAVSDSQYLFTFVVMLLVGLVISNLTVQSRRQALVARYRERRTAQLFALSREMARRREVEELTKLLRRHVLASVEGDAAILLPDAQDHIQDPTLFCARAAGAADRPELRFPVPGNDLGIAQWAYDHGEKAGLGTNTLASADAIYLPLQALKRCIGVLGLRPADPRQLVIPEQMHLVEAMVNLAAVAIERIQLSQSAQVASVAMESERLRNLLLSSVSHDFRTPLATIIGASSSLLESPGMLSTERSRILAQGVFDEAQRMNRLIGNLLDLTRFSAGAISLKREWVALEELVGAVVHRLAGALEGRPLSLPIPPDLPLLFVDEVMIDQVLGNLVENAVKHTPAGSPIGISAELSGSNVVVHVWDGGPGLPSDPQIDVFEKFHRGRAEAAQSGFGLGLSICKAIVEAHGGTILARNRAEGGAEFVFTLPLTEAPP